MKPKNLLCIIIMMMAFGVTWAGVVYDFDNGVVTGSAYPGTDLNGQDGWVNIGGGASSARDDLADRVGLDGLVTYSPSDSQMSRVNSSDWDYGIIGDHIIIEQTGRLGTGQSLTFALGSDVDDDGELNGDEVAFFFGHQSNGGWWIRESAWGGEVKSNVSAGATGIWRIVLDVDLAANGGDGSGSLYVQKIGDDAGNAVEDTLTAVAACQNVDLKISRMAAAAQDPASWNGIFTRNHQTAADNLTIRGDIAAPHAFGAVPNSWESDLLLDPANAVLSWNTGRIAGDWATVNSAITAHKVYIGTPSDPNLLLATTIAVTGTGSADWNPSGQWELEKDTTYFWRVDEVTGAGDIAGLVWKFDTEKTPPQINAHPTDAYVAAGEDAVFTIDAIDPLGTGLSYEWRDGADQVVGGNSATLTISGVQVADEDEFYCILTNASGTVASNSASLTIARLTGRWFSGDDPNDVSGYDNSLDLFNDPERVDGPLEDSYAWQFNGSNQYATVTIGDVLNDYNKQMTMAFWFREDSYLASNSRFINYGFYAGRMDITQYGGTGLQFRYATVTGGTFEKASFGALGEWNHYVAVLDGTTISLYRNGTLADSGNCVYDSLIDVSGQPIVFGARIVSPGPAASIFSNISLADVRAYNYALSDLEIVTMYATITDESICFDRPEFDISGPDGEPDCIVNIYDFVTLASDWLVSNQVDPSEN